MRVTHDIGALKKSKNVAVLQSSRWIEIMEKMQNEGAEKGLSNDFVTHLFKAIHQESIAHQEKIFLGQ